MQKYTVVQHSGSHKPGFSRGLEEMPLSNTMEVTRVTSVGGLIFDDYKGASEYCDIEQYPASATGLYPAAPGTFSDKRIGQQRIYIPVAKK